MIKKYSNAIQKAPVNLYLLYIKLVLENKTTMQFADEVGYSKDYVRHLSSKLNKYLQRELKDCIYAGE